MSTHRIPSLLVFLGLILIAPGCSITDFSELEARGCGETTSCEAGEACVEGYCQGPAVGALQCNSSDCLKGDECDGETMACRKTEAAGSCGYYVPGDALAQEMCLVPAGDYLMGCTGDDCESNTTPSLAYPLGAPLLIDRYEVTNHQYEAYLQASGAPNPNCGVLSLFSASGLAETNEPLRYHPVVCVSALEAQAYCAWAAKHLPSEAQWEAAARGPQGFSYPWGDSFNADFAQCDKAECDNSYDPGSCDGIEGQSSESSVCLTTAPVIQNDAPFLIEGASPFGLIHMAGNVSEWTSDKWSADYSSRCAGVSCALTPSEPAGVQASRAVRGGSYLSKSSEILSWTRFMSEPNDSKDDLGFRCARYLGE